MAASRSNKPVFIRPTNTKREDEAEECWNPTHVRITPDGYDFLMAGRADGEGFSPLVTEHGEPMGRVKLYLTSWIYTYMVDDHKPCAVISLAKLAEVGLILQPIEAAEEPARERS